MPCENCLRALEQGGRAVYELVAFHESELPPLPDRPLTWRDVAEHLIRAAGSLRARDRDT